MKKVFSSNNLSLTAHFKNLLEVQGIPCVMKNYYLTGAVGEVPPDECWPELWILDDAQFAEAEIFIKANQILPTNKSPWQCSHCGEQLEAQFLQCWKCGHSCEKSN